MGRRKAGVGAALAVFAAAVACNLEYHVEHWGLDAVTAFRAAAVSPPATALFKCASAGGFEAFLVAVPLLVWSDSPGARAVGRELLAVLHYSLLGVSLLKTAFAEPRPIHLLAPGDTGYGATSELDAAEYSFPSGHSWATTVAWLTIVRAYAIRFPLLRPLAVVCVAATAASRVYFALHFVHDVAVGIALGILSFFAYPSVAASFATRIAIIVAAALALIFAFDPPDRQRQLGAWYSLGAVALIAALPPPPPLAPRPPATTLPDPDADPASTRATLHAISWPTVASRAAIGLGPLGLGLAAILGRVVYGPRDVGLEAIMLCAGLTASFWVLVGAPAAFAYLRA